MDVHDTRPRSMDGVLDSGISLNGDTGSSPDSDISAQHLQNQPVSICRYIRVVNNVFSVEVRFSFYLPNFVLDEFGRKLFASRYSFL